MIAAPAPALALGSSHLLFLGGDDGVRPVAGPAAHEGFPRDVLAYHTITDTWCRRGEVPEPAVTTAVVPWQDGFVLAGGEVRPGVRTTAVWSCRPLVRRLAIRWPDIAAVVAYLMAVLALGGAFSRQKDTDQFFLAAQRIPWWAAGISIYATMLSSITFMAIPAKAYATDWAYFLGSLTVVALVPVIIGVYLPFFRRVRADSAYEYLERRFNPACRAIASLSFILFQVGRMAIVTVLPALALATVANVDVIWCIAIVGLTSVAYTVVGGIEAVIWADVLQAIVLLGGAVAILVAVILQVPGGAAGVYELAAADAKLFSGVSWSWDVALPTAWVILVGNLFSNLIPYTASQDVVQRYMTTSDAATAARAIRVNALVTVPSSGLFFAVGTALYAFYATFPQRLDPTLPTDAILPLFVSRELPSGLAGLVVAGVFAAAQSTVAGSLTSVSTCWLADFEDRLFPNRDPAGGLGRARRTTAVFGVLGTAGALIVAGLGLTSLWDGFLELLGLTGGALAGLFALGILSRRATGAGAIVGAAASVAALAALKWGLPGRVHMLLYGAIGIVVCFAVGWLASWFIGRGPADLRGLTLFTLGPDAPGRRRTSGGDV
jgi:SSS family transporter